MFYNNCLKILGLTLYVMYYDISTFCSVCAVPNMPPPLSLSPLLRLLSFSSSFSLSLLLSLLLSLSLSLSLSPSPPGIVRVIFKWFQLPLLLLVCCCCNHYIIHMYATTGHWYIHAVLHQNKVTVETKWTNAWCWTVSPSSVNTSQRTNFVLIIKTILWAQCISHRQYSLPQPLW